MDRALEGFRDDLELVFKRMRHHVTRAAGRLSGTLAQVARLARDSSGMRMRPASAGAQRQRGRLLPHSFDRGLKLHGPLPRMLEAMLRSMHHFLLWVDIGGDGVDWLNSSELRAHLTAQVAAEKSDGRQGVRLVDEVAQQEGRQRGEIVEQLGQETFATLDSVIQLLRKYETATVLDMIIAGFAYYLASEVAVQDASDAAGPIIDGCNVALRGYVDLRSDESRPERIAAWTYDAMARQLMLLTEILSGELVVGPSSVQAALPRCFPLFCQSSR